MIFAVVWTSSAVNVCTAERFERRADGKADGLDFVVMVVDEVSANRCQLALLWLRLELHSTLVLGPADLAYEHRFFVA